MNLLGHVAKGVSGAVFGSNPEGYNPEDAAVEGLLSRISDGVLSEDRHDALVALRDLLIDNPQAQLAVGAMGFPVLAEVLREDREDVELLQGALEVLINACGPPPASHGDTHARKEVQAGALNSDLFAREPSNTYLLLSLLEDEPVGVNDFYVRYHTVQLLTALLSSSAYRLQEAILASPMGVIRLMDMMAEREVIRNEALLLLVALTRANEEVQKIAAFEGAFDRLFNIVREEGALDGGIIVQDCLELLNNLLRGNSSNQLMFREMGFLQQVPGMFQASPGLPGDLVDAMGEAFQQPTLLPRQKAANMLCALETVMLLITTQPPPGNSVSKPPEPSQTQEQNLVANKELLLGSGLLDTLLGLGLDEGGVSSSAVRVQALRCVASIVNGDIRNQERLGSAVVKSANQDLPALQAALRSALHAEEALERSAAQELLRCYCTGNPDGQTILASTIAPSGGAMGPDGGSSSFGGDLVRALVGGGSQAHELEASCRAAAALSHLLESNSACKERILRIPLLVPANDAAPPELLLPRVVRYINDALHSGESGAPAAAVLLRLLITWLTDCPPAVAAFLTPASHIPVVMDIANGKLGGGDSCVSGLACVLAGVCLVYCPPLLEDDERKCDSATLLDVLSNRVGLSAYFSHWEELRKHPTFVAASAGPRGPQHFTRATAAAATADNVQLDSLADSPGAGESPFDHQFTVWVAEFQEKAQQFVLTCYARPHQAAYSAGSLVSQLSWSGSEVEQLRAARRALEQADREMQELRARNTSLAENLLKAPSATASGGDQAQDAESSGGGEASAKFARGLTSGTAEAIAAAEVRASKAETEARTAKEQLASLRNKMKRTEEDLSREREEHEQQKAAVMKLEGDLDDLSGAYNTLESHSYGLESQVKELKLKLKAMEGLAVSASSGGAAGGITEEEVQARVEEAVAAAQAEGEESMTDLLECLGQEEAKVERLREKLEELGEDVDALLEGIGEEEDGEDEDGGEGEEAAE